MLPGLGEGRMDGQGSLATEVSLGAREPFGSRAGDGTAMEME